MSSNGKVNCTCGWSWNKSDSSKKDMYICHECGRDNSNNMKNGGWLDNYGTKENPNDSSVSLPEGFVGMGNNTKGRDYSPAWGGQFAMGGSIPGSVGFTYARTKGIPSEGPYAKKTMPSAQEGRTITIDEGDGKKRKILTDSSEYAKLYDEGRIGVQNDDESISFNPLNEVVVTPYDKQYPFYQELSDEEKKYFNSDTPIGRQLRSRAQDNVGFNADKATDFAMGWLRDLPLASLQAPQSALVEGVEALRGNDFNMLNALEPDKQRIPSETWGVENPYAAFAVDALTDPETLMGMSILKNPLQKGIKQLGNVKTSISPELRQGLRTAGPSFGSSIDNVGSSYPSFKQITNAPENIDTEHLSGLIKRETDWLRSPEYLKRKMSATGRSEASIKKESEDIINHINNTSINYTGTLEDGVSGLYSSGRNPKIQIFNGVADYPFYEGVLDHEVKHAFSETAAQGDPLIDYITGKGYKNYPKANLNKTIGDKISSTFGMNWANLAPEQQVSGRRMMDVIENTQGVKRGTQLNDSNVENLVEHLRKTKSNNADMYEIALGFKNKFGDNYQKHLKDFLNEAWVVVPAAVGLGAASQLEQKREGGIIKDDMGQYNHPGEITEINSPYITMEGVPYPVLGISDTGDTKLMKPGKNYKFKGKKVTEFPMAKNGLRQEQKGLVNLDQLTNFTNYNTKQPGGWLDKYSK